MKISIVIPVFNEKDSINQLYNEIINSLNIRDYEIIFIDDGSTDGSSEIVQELIQNNEKVNLIQFYRNYGKSAALSEGFKHSEGDYVVTMDADLQDDPTEIENLINKLEEGFDVVSGWKKNRKDPLSKRLPSKLFNFITRIFTSVKIHDFNCGLKIYKKSVIKTLDIYGGRHRYIPALAGQKKFKVSEIIVNHRSRKHGVTKYGGRRFFHGFFDLISVLFLSRYIQSPLYFFGQLGLFAFLFGFGIEGYVLYLKYMLGEPFAKHFALLMLGVLLIVIGIQFFSIGLIGEMIANSNQDKESRIKKIYKV
ncbi:MAG: glycosyltransferase family 2 protein [Candidatus Neomarinimicrobiota bacterium]|nr:glycosyltransferase family 2 protein [Candidatus Neomarinimicrobiota bacterium]MED5433264.1 glycosyltransferase family 2 protein [Candidatus Neomarinimicrobiota bacterium]MEE3302345.1 glycosyltransferase family 2 protein [Candidatus Neomarinimicrobiota bacterium]